MVLAGTFFCLEHHSIRSYRHIQHSGNNSDESHHHSAPSAKEMIMVENSKINKVGCNSRHKVVDNAAESQIERYHRSWVQLQKSQHARRPKDEHCWERLFRKSRHRSVAWLDETSKSNEVPFVTSLCLVH